MNVLAPRHERAGPIGASGMERSFAKDVEKLLLGDGEVFEGEAILAITKALLQAGVAYVGGYPGAPVSHLMDVLAEARDRVLKPMGVQFEASASEAGAAALLGASIHYPLRGAVTWKSIVGTNVASDALSNLTSAGVTGGAVIIVGEDYGEGASVIQERTHATALKSSMPLIDPRYHMPTLVRLTEAAFDLSEASHLPVIISLRIRAAHMTGAFVCKDNVPPRYGANNPLPQALYDYDRIVLPPSTYAQEKLKIDERLPAARRFIVEHGLNEHFPGDGRRIGIVLQGGTYGTVLRSLLLLGAADAFGETPVPLLVLNVIHPLVPEQITDFLAGKDSVLVVEEGNPPFIQQQIRAIAQEKGIACRIHGKDVLPEAGEYTANVIRAGVAAYLAEEDAGIDGLGKQAAERQRATEAEADAGRKRLAVVPPPRPPSFCTGCPERPIFTALKLLQRERGPIHISSDIGCNTFSTLPPFNMGSTVLGYGMSLASGGAVGPALGKPTVAVMGDGGFWHNGLVSGAINAQWNGHDAVLVILENGYASATGQQHVPSTGSTPWGQKIRVSIEKTLAGDRRRLAPAGRRLRCRQDAEHAPPGARRARPGAAGGDLRRRMHAGPAPPRKTGRSRARQGGPVGGQGPLRRRRGGVRRRPLVHAAQRLSVADPPAGHRSAQGGADRDRRPRLRRLQPVRRDRPRGKALSLVLQGDLDRPADPVAGVPRSSQPASSRDRRRVMTADRPICVVIAALGGQGGGVLADWLVTAARHDGFPAQMTSIPGVAQRTGATTYYFELFPEKAPPKDPVFSIYPSSGDVSLLAALEPTEAGRALAQGFVGGGTTVVTTPAAGVQHRREDARGRRHHRRGTRP